MTQIPTKEGLMKWVDDYADAVDLDARETLILTKFAAYAAADMTAWAAIKTLAKQGRSSERKVQYVLRDFEAAGVIRRTGAVYRLPGSGRELPVYEFRAYLDTLSPEAPTAKPMGARGAPILEKPSRDGGPTGAPRAPIENLGCTDGGVTGAQGVHPYEHIEHNTSPSGEDAGARQRKAGFEDLERAYDQRGLGFTHRDRAFAEFRLLLDQGVTAADLIAAAKRYAVDPKRRRELGLDHWLVDRKFRAWLGEAAAPAEPSRTAFAGPAALRAAVAGAKGEGFAASYLDRADFADGVLRAATAFAFGKLSEVKNIIIEQGVTLVAPEGAGHGSGGG